MSTTNKYAALKSHGPTVSLRKQLRLVEPIEHARVSPRVVHNQRQLDEKLDQHPKASVYAIPLGIVQGARSFRQFEYVDSDEPQTRTQPSVPTEAEHAPQKDNS